MNNSSPPISSASEDFLGACASARTAWHKTSLLSLSKTSTILNVKDEIKSGTAERITEIILEVMGPVAPVKLKDAMNLTTFRHRELAGIVCLLAVRRAFKARKKDQPIDLDEIKSMLVRWIDFGHLSPVAEVRSGKSKSKDAEVLQSMDISDLIAQTCPQQAPRLRLAVIAPLAPAIESLIIVSRLSDSYLSMMDQTHAKVSYLDKLQEDALQAQEKPKTKPSRNPFQAMFGGLPTLSPVSEAVRSRVYGECHRGV